MSTPVVDSFLIAEAAELSGLSRVMLDYLSRQGVLIPTAPGRRGRGNARKYSFGDVVMLRGLACLLGAGVSVHRLKKALASLRPQHKRILPTSPLPARFLVTDGKHVFFRDSDALIDLDGSGQMSFLFVIEIENLRKEVIANRYRMAANGRS